MTRPYAEVIGDPVAHSKSPLIHNFWLEALGMEAEYRAHRVGSAELPRYVEHREADPDWRGCNVTIPHKVAVLDHVADPGDVRGTIGAMNTVARGENGNLFGTNTDAAGFYLPIAELDLTGRRIAVVGAGGAARAVLFALKRMRVGSVTIFNRTPLKASSLLAHFGLEGEAKPLNAALPAAELLVNASALGMADGPALDMDLSPLPPHAVVYDLVYTPRETPLLKAARARALTTVEGLEMLIGQAALAFEFFFAAAPPRGRDDDLRALLVK